MKFFIKKLLIISFAIFIASFGFNANAAFNEQINYQGKLTDSNGIAVADGTYCIKFAIYDALTDGSELWSEVWNAGNAKVTLRSGLFSVMLGSHTSISSVDFNNASRYLEVQFDANSACDDVYEEVFAPRKVLGSVPAAFEAKQMGGFTWAVPGAIGSTTPNSGSFATMSVSNIFTTSNGSLLSSASGVMTLGGTGGANNENLTLDFESTADKVKINSSTGAATIDLNGLNITTTGTGTFGNLQTGADGADGQLTIYSEQGATDYSLIFQPNAAMTASTTYIWPAATPTTTQVLQSDAAGNMSWGTIDSSNFVPYTGASSDVNLGAYDLTATDLTVTGTALLGDATSDIHGINTAAVANQMLTASYASAANAANYLYHGTQTSSADTSGGKNTYGFYLNQDISGTDTNVFSLVSSEGISLDIDDTSTVNNSSAFHYARGITADVTFGGTNTSNFLLQTYGGYFISTGNMGTSGGASHYGVYSSVGGTADTNYGIYLNSTGATTNWALYNANGNMFMGVDSKLTYWGSSSDASMTFDGNSLNIIANAVTAADALELTAGSYTLKTSADTDLVLNFSGTTNSGVLTWMEDESNFKFTNPIQIGDNGTDGQLTIYSEQGATDYSLIFQPNAAMTASTTYIWPAATPTTTQVLQSDAAGNMSWGTIDSSNFVPYTGASSDVNLGAYDLTATDLTVTGTALLGDATSDIHGINTAAVANQMLTASYASSADAASYFIRGTQTSSANTTGSKFTYGYHIAQTISGTDTNNLSPSNAYGFYSYVNDSSTINNAAAIHSDYGTYSGSNFSGTNTNNIIISAYGGYFYASGNMGTTGNTAHAALNTSARGTADVNYGIYLDSAGATTNYSLYVSAGNAYMGQDTIKTIWGTGSDASIYYNGTDLIIDPKEVGTGVVNLNGGGLTTTGTVNTGNLQTGADGADGQLTIYSEQGATDYSLIFQPNAAMTASTTYIWPAATPTTTQVLQSDAAGNMSWGTIDSSNFVPYTGASSDVNLGAYDLTATDLTVTGTALLGDATSDIHGINTAAVANQMLTASYASAALTSYFIKGTQSSSSDSSVGKNTYGYYLDQNISGTDTDTGIPNAIPSYGVFLDIDDTSTLNGSSSYREIFGVYSDVNFAGTNTNNIGIHPIAGYFTSTGNIGTTGGTYHAGLYSSVSGTADNNYGIYISSGGATTNWALYNAAGNMFMGIDNAVSYWGSANDASMTFDGNSLNIIANAVTAADALELTAGSYTLKTSTDTDLVLNFSGTTNSGVLTWMEDESNFKFKNPIQIGDNGTSGQLTIYSEQGATDYSLIFQPNAAMTASTTYIWPAATASATQVLQSDTAGNLSWATVVSGAAGSNTQVQYNNSGAFGASSNFTYDGNTLGITSTSAAQEKLSYDGSNYATMTTGATGNLTIATATGTTGGDIILDPASTGDSSILSDSGVLILGGSAGTNNEDLKFDFETSANKALITSTTGATDIDFGSINLATTGTLTLGGSTAGTLVTRVKAGIPDEADANGSIVVDSTNYRFYFRYGGAWHYVAQTAGFQIPDFETIDPISGDQIKEGDIVLGMINQTMEDTALHGIWVKWDSVKDQLLGELSGEEGSLSDGKVNGIKIKSTLDRVKEALLSLGITVKDGITNISQLAVEKFDTKIARVGQLEMVDKNSGEIYCTWLEGGEWKKSKGDCLLKGGEVTNINQSVSETEPIITNIQSTSETETTITNIEPTTETETTITEIEPVSETEETIIENENTDNENADGGGGGSGGGATENNQDTENNNPPQEENGNNNQEETPENGSVDNKKDDNKDKENKNNDEEKKPDETAVTTEEIQQIVEEQVQEQIQNQVIPFVEQQSSAPEQTETPPTVAPPVESPGPISSIFSRVKESTASVIQFMWGGLKGILRR